MSSSSRFGSYTITLVRYPNTNWTPLVFCMAGDDGTLNDQKEQNREQIKEQNSVNDKFFRQQGDRYVDLNLDVNKPPNEVTGSIKPMSAQGEHYNDTSMGRGQDNYAEPIAESESLTTLACDKTHNTQGLPLIDGDNRKELGNTNINPTTPDNSPQNIVRPEVEPDYHDHAASLGDDILVNKSYFNSAVAILNARPPDSQVEGALQTERIPYISFNASTDSKPASSTTSVGENSENPNNSMDIRSLYSVKIANDEWKIIEHAFSDKATIRTLKVPYQEVERENLDPEHCFDLDRILLNRLYLLAYITTERWNINQWLEKTFNSHKEAHRAKSSVKRRNSLTFLQGQKFFPWCSIAISFSAVVMIWLKVFEFDIDEVFIFNIALYNILFDVTLFSFGLASFLGVTSLVLALWKKQGKTIEDKLVENVSEVAIAFRSRLSQVNLKVASGYASINDEHLEADRSLVPESFLRKIDDILGIKAAFESLDKVIATQLQSVTNDHKKKQEHRLHSYQNIVAASSGIFTGFFIYEVGDSVLKYIHASELTDDRSLQYWFSTRAGVNATNLASSKQNGSSSNYLPYGEKEHGIETVNISVLDKTYQNYFVHHELVGQAWLLTITILVTWFAGYVGWHKHHDENDGGHEHHS